MQKQEPQKNSLADLPPWVRPVVLDESVIRALGIPIGPTQKRKFIQAMDAYESNPNGKAAGLFLERIRRIASQMEETEAKTIESAIERLNGIPSDDAASTIEYLKACLMCLEAIKRKPDAEIDPDWIKEFFVAVIERDPERINRFIGNAMRPAFKDNGLRMYDSIALGKEQVQENPRSMKAHCQLGRSYRWSYMFDEAIETLNRAIKLAPDEGEEHHLADAHYELAYAYLPLGRFDKAIESFREVLRLNPTTAVSTLWSIGDACNRAGRLDGAIESYMKAAELSPTHAVARHELGKVYLELGRYDEAIESFQSALEINPKFGEAHFNLGKSFAGLGKGYVFMIEDCAEVENEDEAEEKAKEKANEHFEQAIACFKNRVEERADDADPHYWLGRVYFELGRYEDAVNSLKKATELNFHSSKAYYALGKVYFAQEKYEEAVSAYSTAIALEEQDSGRYRPQRNADHFLARAQAYEAIWEMGLGRKDWKMHHRLKHDNWSCNNAIYSENGWERSSALTSIEEQFPDDDYMRDLFFVDIARYCRFADTCIYAVNQISSDERLKDVAKDGKNEHARFRAVERIQDQKILEDIAKNPGYLDAQQFAVDRLSGMVDDIDDIKTLELIATKSTNEHAMRAAVEKLAAHIEPSGVNWRVFASETNAKIAIHSTNTGARNTIIGKLYCDDLLMDVVVNSEYPDTQQAAMRKLEKDAEKGHLFDPEAILFVLCRTEDENAILEMGIRLAEKAFKSDSNEPD